jgi:hypothetical protein
LRRGIRTTYGWFLIFSIKCEVKERVKVHLETQM